MLRLAHWRGKGTASAKFNQANVGSGEREHFVGDSQYINVQPHPRILGVLGDIEFSHWQCIAELVDNCFDEFRSAGDQTITPTVSIVLPAANTPRSTAAITVKDNGRGMGLEAVTNAISAGWSSNGRHGSLGLFGMGFNISTARLGRQTSIRTSRAGDAHWVEVVLDLPRISRSSDYLAPYRLVPKADANEHGTTVTISDLKTEQFDSLRRPQTQKIIREKLGDIYSYLLHERGYLLTINRTKVSPRLPCVWNEARYVTRSGVGIPALLRIEKTLSEKQVCMDCGYWSRVDAQVCEECGQPRLKPSERRIWGWLGVQRYVHSTDYGVDFIRNGRKILLKDKKVFYWQDDDELAEPELEYPIDSKKPMGRLVGEIHCDHVAPNYQKTAFEFDTHEWRQVLREVRGNSPLRPVIARRLGLPENTSPLARLYVGFRRQDAGLNYLIPGDGTRALHERAVEWADYFRKGELAYQTDEIWYQAAYQHDNPVLPTPRPESENILPGLEAAMFEEEGSSAVNPASEERAPEPPEETLEQRLARYRANAEPVFDLTGGYSVPELGTIELSVWAVRGQRLHNKERVEAPIVAIMQRAPRLEVFIDVDDPLFKEQGSDTRDLALIEVAEFMRVRARSVSTPLTSIVSRLKSQSGTAPLTPAAMADEAERILDEVRSGLVVPVSESPRRHWDTLTSAERSVAERRFAVESVPGSSWEENIFNGNFVRYVPASAVVRLISVAPEAFLDGRLFKRTYAALTDAMARELVVERLVNPLSDLALLEQHRPRLDPEELARIRFSCRLISRDLVDSA
ncbi:ATP-binding protein [Streptomyces sp. NPDC050535]|uniref:ATP-binding protein n=1 Tax=Streptomyces sp. NPDC050535 TaxID=3365626 RepID=UPI003795A024